MRAGLDVLFPTIVVEVTLMIHTVVPRTMRPQRLGSSQRVADQVTGDRSAKPTGLASVHESILQVGGVFTMSVTPINNNTGAGV